MARIYHSLLYCWICDKEVSLETCQIDECGTPVHEACLFAKTKLEAESSRLDASYSFNALFND
jgi:hypothetical protein